MEKVRRVKDVGRWLYWGLWASVKLALFFVGLVVVPFTDKKDNPVWGNREGQKEGRWEDYKWRALRNPVNNMRFWFEEPTYSLVNVYGSPHPEDKVRGGFAQSAKRTIRTGKYIEYWKVWRTDEGKIAELRVGWKFSGIPGFGVTLQYRKGS